MHTGIKLIQGKITEIQVVHPTKVTPCEIFHDIGIQWDHD